jgi:hypothetical protein
MNCLTLTSDRRTPAPVWLAAALALLMVAGCARTPQPAKTAFVGNNGYQLDQFTDANGCTVYRFYDQGDWRYYVVGPNGPQMLPSSRPVVDTTSGADMSTQDMSCAPSGHKK